MSNIPHYRPESKPKTDDAQSRNQSESGPSPCPLASPKELGVHTESWLTRFALNAISIIKDSN